MKKIAFAALAALLTLVPAASPASTTAPRTTLTGIALDAPWKQKLYAFAQEKLLHPAWGWTHSERDYRLATEIAAKEHLKVDTDVLFAAAFIHDIGAIGAYQKDGVDHAVRSAELAGPMLVEMGFPADKVPAVNDAILTHMHDHPTSQRPEAIVLHDADTVDFLGTVGVIRRISATGSAPDYKAGLAKVRDFADKLPGRVVTRTAHKMAASRVREMQRLLAELDSETADGRLP